MKPPRRQAAAPSRNTTSISLPAAASLEVFVETSQLDKEKAADAARVMTDDVRQLESMGYAQELLRRMSGFSNFAISFSIICILAGGITSLQLGVSAVGGAAAGVIWPLGMLFS